MTEAGTHGHRIIDLGVVQFTSIGCHVGCKLYLFLSAGSIDTGLA